MSGLASTLKLMWATTMAKIPVENDVHIVLKILNNWNFVVILSATKYFSLEMGIPILKLSSFSLLAF